MDKSDIIKLVEYLKKEVYYANTDCEQGRLIMQKCCDLIGMDYVYSIVTNTTGDLSTNYPSHLIILEREKSKAEQEKVRQRPDRPLENNGLKKCMNDAKLGRVWTRFPVPVIFFEGKNICRSSTLAGSIEVLGRNIYKFCRLWKKKTASVISSDFEGRTAHATNKVKVEAELADLEQVPAEDEAPPADDPKSKKAEQEETGMLAAARSHDIVLLERLNVNTIIDLMVENRKWKGIVCFSSSEKVEEDNRYKGFELVSLPYPGCEFFAQYRDKNFDPNNLFFDWSDISVDAPCKVPEGLPTVDGVDWSEYQVWDLVEMTSNYLKLILLVINVRNSGVLVHCISGWDRTPLFICLIRLSLWADGLIHKSLNSTDILYLTLAYDWLLFGHNLPNRKIKGEHVLLYCFNYLKYLATEDFSLLRCRSTVSTARVAGAVHETPAQAQARIRTSPPRSSPPSNVAGKSSSPVAVPSACKSRERNESVSSGESCASVDPAGSNSLPKGVYSANGLLELRESTESTATVSGAVRETPVQAQARIRRAIDSESPPPTSDSRSRERNESASSGDSSCPFLEDQRAAFKALANARTLRQRWAVEDESPTSDCRSRERNESASSGDSSRISPSQRSPSSNVAGKGSSPVAVPSASKSRERNESVSSVESWGFVNQAGSYSPKKLVFNANISSERRESKSTATVTEAVQDPAAPNGAVQETVEEQIKKRAERIYEVRDLFYRTFWPKVIDED